MMRKLWILFAALPLWSCTQTTTEPVDRADRILATLNDAQTDQVLVASHRGDWRNFPENSLPAIRSAIQKGVDIIELDLKMTADSVLILMHDAKIDRTTTGKGLVSDLTYDSIQKVNLRAGQNIATAWKVPTLEEALDACKGRALVNIDQGFQFYELIHPILERTGMLEYTLIKGRVTAAEADETFGKHEKNCLFMPIVNFGKPDHEAVMAGYVDCPPLAYEVCWREWAPEVETYMQDVLKQGSKLWVNSLWPSLNGGWCDDAAVEGSTEEIYGRLIGLGATLIQTDRIDLLIGFLRERGLHE